MNCRVDGDAYSKGLDGLAAEGEIHHQYILRCRTVREGGGEGLGPLFASDTKNEKARRAVIIQKSLRDIVELDRYDDAAGLVNRCSSTKGYFESTATIFGLFIADIAQTN